MGVVVSGRCSCGYAAEWLSVGVGMRYTPGLWLSPCLCRKCRKAVSANVLAKTLKCPLCKAKGVEPYMNPDAGQKGGKPYRSCATSGPLFDSGFECPACGEKSLKFVLAGIWD